MYFEGNNVDNDALLDLVRLLESRGDRWGIAVISKSGGTLETAAALRVLLRELRGTLGGDAKSIGELVVPVTGSTGKLFELANALGCRETFPVPDGVGGRFSVLSAVGLLPGALLGLDIEKMLRGAAAVNDHFRTVAPEKNAVLQFVGVCHLLERAGCEVRILATWGKRLESFGLWYDQLLAESLGKQERGALPLTIVNTRDLHSRGQQHQEGKRDKLVTNVIVERPQGDPVPVGRSELDQDGLNELAQKSLPDIMAAAIAGTNKAYRDDRRPTTDLRIPRLDEFTLGQLFQFMMLATVVEGRLIGINPYGQPGVEAYKRNMNAILRSKS
jgi:glucose-6-phosphate isomerase